MSRADGPDFVNGIHLSEIREWEPAGGLCNVRTAQWGWLTIAVRPERLRKLLARFAHTRARENPSP